jgi:hypothetical protein
MRLERYHDDSFSGILKSFWKLPDVCQERMVHRIMAKWQSHGFDKVTHVV